MHPAISWSGRMANTSHSTSASWHAHRGRQAIPRAQLLAFFRRDYKGVAQAHLESGWVPADTRVDELEAAVRAVCEPVFDRPLKEIPSAACYCSCFRRRVASTWKSSRNWCCCRNLLNIEGLGRNSTRSRLWKPPSLPRTLDERAIGWRALVSNLQTEVPKWRRCCRSCRAWRIRR